MKGEIMPYRIRGKVVQKKTNGWKKKAKAKNPASAKRMVNLLRGVEHGWKPTGKKARSLRKRKKKKIKKWNRFEAKWI